MKQEDKKLLLRDLCARLPYGVIVKLNDNFKFNKGDRVLVKELLDLYCIKELKPYLRPMSSMTEEEKKEFNSLINGVEERCINAYGKGGYTLAFTEVNDWLNAHHFDYRGLIEKSLAIEAPEGMYN